MPTHYRGNTREVRALNAFIRFIRGAESLTALLARRLGEKGLTESQFSTLEALYHLGPMPQRELAKKLLKSSGNVTTVVDNLERQGLVRRRRNRDDRRFVTVNLTQKGSDLVKETFPGQLAAIQKILSCLTPAEQEELGRLSKRVGLSITDSP